MIADLLKSENRLVETALLMETEKRAAIFGANGGKLEELTHKTEQYIARLEALQNQNRQLIGERLGEKEGSLKEMVEKALARLNAVESQETSPQDEAVQRDEAAQWDEAVQQVGRQQVEQLEHIAAKYRANLQKLKEAVLQNRQLLEHTAELVRSAVEELQDNDTIYSHDSHSSKPASATGKNRGTGLLLTTDA